MKKLLRLIICPFIFLYGILFTGVFMFFPIPFVMIISAVGVILTPVIYLINKAGGDIKHVDSLFSVSKYQLVNHFIGVITPLWIAPKMTYDWVTEETF